MSLSNCISKVSNEIRRQKILLQKDKKQDEAAAYEADLNAAMAEIKESLGDVTTLDSDNQKAIQKLNSIVESLSLDRDELVVQIEAKGGKVETAKTDDGLYVEPVKQDVQTKQVKDENGNTATEVVLPSGKTVQIQRLTSGESMGLPGWHGPDGYLADTKDDAVKLLVAKESKTATVSAEKEQESAPDISVRFDDMFAQFLPNTPEGEKAWRVMAPDTDGTGKVLIAHADSVIAQLRKSGYTVKESKPSDSIDDDALLADLGEDDGAKNDRNTYSVKRYNNETNAIDKESFSRGEYVRVASVDAGAKGKESFGEISGISHTNQEAKIGEVWYSFGQIYKAEKPAEYEPPKVSIDSVINSVNSKNSDGLTEADRISTAADHKAFVNRLVDGNVSIDEFKGRFESIIKSKTPLVDELNKLTKAALLDMLGGYRAQRYKSDNKDKIVDAIYRGMMDDFVLGDSISYGFGSKYEDVIRNYVNGYSQADLDAYAERAKAAQDSRKQRAEEVANAIKNPESYSDYKIYIRAKMNDGMTMQEARLTLPVEQRAKFDDEMAEETRSQRIGREEVAKTTVRSTSQTTGGELFETKHTKTGDPLFVVKTADRVERDVYNEWNATAKKMGGYYSSFKGGGAIPGFTFKSKDVADAFMSYIGGNAVAAQDAIKADRDAFADDRSQSAAERLIEMSERLEEKANSSLNQERKANTDRRARFAASAEAAANKDIALAKTMRNIAESINEGIAKFLDRVRQKSQIEMLRTYVNNAKWDEVKAQNPNGWRTDDLREKTTTIETADYAKFPNYTAFRSDLARMGRELIQINGGKKLGQRLLKVADDITTEYKKFAKDNLRQVSVFKLNDGSDAVFSTEDKAEDAIARSGHKGKATVVSFKRGQHMVIMGPEMAREKGIWTGDDDKRLSLDPEFAAEIVGFNKGLNKRTQDIRMPWVFDQVHEDRARFKAIGVETPAELRAALREFVALQELPAEANKIKEMERAMIGRKNDGLDFFPTSSEVVNQMLEAADIKEGMSVLEPSAGMGHIADKIRDFGVDPDVIEMSGDRRELLEAKGFRLIGNDFIEVTPRSFTFGDVFKDQDDVTGVMRGSGGLGSNRVSLQPLDDSTAIFVDRDSLTPVEKRASGAGYDRIVMNPPFSDRRDAEHVQHAFTLLKPGGRIVAIMGEGVFFGQDAKAKAFREWLDSVGGTSEKLEEGSFLDPSLPVNTAVNARLVVIDKSESAYDKPVFNNNEESIPADEWISESEILDYLIPTLSQFRAEIPVRIIDRVDEKLARKLGVEDSNVFPSGFVHNGKIHLVRSGIRDRDSLSRTLFHEMLHFGIRRFLPKSQYIEVMNQLFESDATVRKSAKAWLNTEEAQELYKKTGDAKYVMARATDEALAEISEQIHSNNVEKVVVVNDKKGTFLQNVKDWLATLARKFGMNSVADMLDPPAKTKNEIKANKVEMEKGTEDFILSIFAKLKGDENPSDAGRSWAYSDAAFMTAWHGSPHDHNKFDSSKIGTGEGAQSFGYGLYFAGARGVAEWYRDNLSKDFFSKNAMRDYKGVDDLSDDFAAALLQIIDHSKSGLSVEQIKDRAKEDGIDEILSNPLFAEYLGERWESVVAKKGKLYQVELAPSENEYLDWDKPLSEQSELVRDALKDADIEIDGVKLSAGDGIVLDPNVVHGTAIYGYLSKMKDGDKAASDYLHSIGIRGIRYLDGPSRGAGYGNHNYVIFSDADVSITAKYPADDSESSKRFVSEFLTELSFEDAAFRHGISKSKTLEGNMKAVNPKIEYIGEDTRPDEMTESKAEKRFVFAMPDGEQRLFYVYEKGNEVWIDVSRLQIGDGGNDIYHAIANYAFNTGRVFVGDPMGLSEDAVIRRTSAMLSSALRFGTTEHIDAAPEQIAGNDEKGIEPLDWRGNDLDKTNALIHTFVTTLQNKFPKIDGYRYDFSTQRFLDRNGRSVSRERFHSAAKSGVSGDARAGQGSLRRGILIQSLASSKSSERPGILESVINGAAQLLSEKGGLKAVFAKDAKHTNETPESIRSALVERFGKDGIAALEKSGMLKIIPFNDAPASILETAIEGNASALYTVDGVAYLFSDRMTKEDAPGKLLHELGEHHGLESMIGADGWNRIKKRIAVMSKAKGSIAHGAWNGVKQNYNEFAGKSDLELSDNDRFLHEVLAAIGENKDGQKTSLWRELLAKLKDWLSSKGILSNWMNEGDIANLVNGSLKKIMREAEDGLVARSTMGGIITDYFQQIIQAMKSENNLIEDCA